MCLASTIFLFIFLMPACSSRHATSTPDLPPAIVTIISFQSPTPAPKPTPTLTIDELIQPYTIEGLRQRVFLVGLITYLSELETTGIYKRYSISYPSDGLTITGILQVPVEGKAPFPVIIMNHGYFNRGDYSSGDGTDRAAEFLNRHGYITISSDYRSWGDSEDGPSLFYSGLVIDVVNLLQAVPSIPQADAGRIGMWGHSMGGGVTVKVLTLETPVRAAVLYSTVSPDNADLVNRWGMGCIGDIIAGERLYGCNSADIIPEDLPRPLIEAYRVAAEDPLLISKVSPSDHLDLVAVPVQIHYGTEDGKTYSSTPPDWSRKLAQGLVDAGGEVEIFAYEGQAHSFIGDSWYAFMERSARFFDLNVKNVTPTQRE